MEKKRRIKSRTTKPSGRADAEGLVARNVTVDGFRTSLRLEPQLWRALAEICEIERIGLNDICVMVDRRRSGLSRTSAVRVFALNYFRAAAQSSGRRSSAGILAALPELAAFRQQQQQQSSRRAAR